MGTPKSVRDAQAKRDAAMCFQKSRYPTKDVARGYANKAESARGDKLRIYFCPICSGYHLTKQVAP